MSLVVLSIDTMLAALSEIGRSLGASHVCGARSVYFGMSLVSVGYEFSHDFDGTCSPGVRHRGGGLPVDVYQPAPWHPHRPKLCRYNSAASGWIYDLQSRGGIRDAMGGHSRPGGCERAIKMLESL